MSILSSLFFTQNIVVELFSLIVFGIILIQITQRFPSIQYFIIIAIPILFIFKNLKHYFKNFEGEPPFVLFKFFNHLEIKFHYTLISCTFLAMVGSLWLLNNLYSVGYLKIKQIEFTSFMTIIFASIGCVILIVSSGNLITLFTFYEILTFTTYFLVSFVNSPESTTAGHKYLTTLFVTSTCFFLTAVSVIYAFSDNLNFMSEGILSYYPQFTEIWFLPLIVILLFLYGCSKSATIPFHFWLPKAMSAEIPVSALLHAVAVVKSGIIALLYVVIYVFGLSFLSNLQSLHPFAFQIPKYLAGLSAILASIMALRNTEFKKVLAYSTVGQLGYMVMIIFSFHQEMPKVLMLQLVAHAFGKINMFFIAGFLYLKYKTKRVDKLYGVWKFEPVIAVCFAISVFSIIGIPPTIGMLGKFNIMIYSIKNEEFFILGVILFGTILNCYYFLPILSDMFFGVGEDSEKNIKVIEIQPKVKKYYNLLYIPITLTAALIIAMFFIPYKLLTS